MWRFRVCGGGRVCGGSGCEEGGGCVEGEDVWRRRMCGVEGVRSEGM